jgi:hypothetical protein
MTMGVAMCCCVLDQYVDGGGDLICVESVLLGCCLLIRAGVYCWESAFPTAVAAV